MDGELDALMRVLRALGDPVRWQLLREVARHEEVPRKELTEAGLCSSTMASYHCRILQGADLIDVRTRGRERFYAVRTDTVEELAGHVRALLRAGPLAELGRIRRP